MVSIIIPAYKAAGFIGATIDSVFAQTYRDFEIIVVNDGSPDTAELETALAPYSDRIVYLKQQNLGLAGARNTGLSEARGDLVALLDADDLWLPTYLEEQTRYLAEHPEVDLVYCDAELFGDPVYEGKRFMSICPSEGKPDSRGLISRTCHVFVSVTARTAALRAVGFDQELRSCEDFDCWLRFAAAGYQIGYQRKVLVRYRKHPESLSADPTWMAQSSLRVLTKAVAFWPEGSEEARLLASARVGKAAQLATLRGKVALRNGDSGEAVRQFREANLYFRSMKLRAVILLLRLAPGLLKQVFWLRGAIAPEYRDATTRVPVEQRGR